ncbi:MAG: hypothetical protein K6L73_00475 [Cellvibrionaceae bacterium]
MFKNKHVIAALIITPLLAILGYFAVDLAVSEKPHAAVKGSAYQLVEKPNCRYSSGICGLKNGEFEVNLSAETTEDGFSILKLDATHTLDMVMVATYDKSVSNQLETEPVAMSAGDEKKQHWELKLPQIKQGQERIQLAIVADEVMYYGDVDTLFYHYETAFEKDFR